MKRIQWIISMYKRMTPPEEEIMIENMIKYLIVSFFAILAIVMLVVTVINAFNGVA